jgi:hypothetical protein
MLPGAVEGPSGEGKLPRKTSTAAVSMLPPMGASPAAPMHMVALVLRPGAACRAATAWLWRDDGLLSRSPTRKHPKHQLPSTLSSSSVAFCRNWGCAWLGRVCSWGSGDTLGLLVFACSHPVSCPGWQHAAWCSCHLVAKALDTGCTMLPAATHGQAAALAVAGCLPACSVMSCFRSPS